MIKINEIFYSIQGESSWTGWPTVFVRTSGCHLRCTYCDTTYAYHEGHHQSVDEILAKVKSYPAQHVCVTGGEPLLQKDIYSLMNKLCESGYKVSLETSGDIDCSNVNTNVQKIIDVKTPSSGEAGRFDMANLKLAGAQTEFKFVINSEEDFAWAKNFSSQHNLCDRSLVLFSPSHDVISEQWLAQKILNEMPSARLQLQLHKYIWSSQQRGV